VIDARRLPNYHPHLAAQIFVKVTAVVLVHIDIQVDPLLTDSDPFFLVQPATDLFWTPVLAQKRFNLVPVCRADSSMMRCLAAPADQFLGLLRPISSLALVALELPADG
jgi:hypothetical protein